MGEEMKKVEANLNETLAEKLESNLKYIEEENMKTQESIEKEAAECRILFDQQQNVQGGLNKTLETLKIKGEDLEALQGTLKVQLENIEKTSKDNSNPMEENVKQFEIRLESLTEKVNHFMQNVMVVRSLPQKVMHLQKKISDLEEKYKS